MLIKIKVTDAFINSLTTNDREKVIKNAKNNFFTYTDKEDLQILRQLAQLVDGLQVECFLKK